jgi:glutaryl-CoA dehydrogenase
MISETAASFANKELSVRVERAYNEEIIDEGIFKLMGETGLLGCTIPEEFGGLGANYVTYGLITREIEKVDSGYRSMMSVQSSLVMYPISKFGSQEQKEKYLPKLASGESIGCFGLTEAGSEPEFASVKPKHPILSPDANFGKYFSFCS